MVNILIVEKNLQYGANIMNEISKSNQNLRFCGIVNTKESFNKFVCDFNIDIILIDLEFFKELDYNTLQTYQNSIIFISHTPAIISNKDFNTFYLTDISKIKEKIKELITQNSKNNNNENIKNIIKKELDYLGYKSSYKGSLYLLETIYILNTLPNYYNNNLSKDVYPLVARKFNTSPLNVKYNIRNATEVMYYNCDENKLCDYLGYNILNKPGTKDIIDAIENKIYKYL